MVATLRVRLCDPNDGVVVCASCCERVEASSLEKEIDNLRRHTRRQTLQLRTVSG